MKDKIMALDLGSTGIKVAVFDAQANILGSVYGEYKTEYPGPNMTLQSPTDWWNYFCDASKKLLAEHHISPDDIACVAPSGQMSALIPLDRDGTLRRTRARSGRICAPPPRCGRWPNGSAARRKSTTTLGLG